LGGVSGEGVGVADVAGLKVAAVQLDGPAAVSGDGERAPVAIDPLDGPGGSVLNAEHARVAQADDAVPGGKLALCDAQPVLAESAVGVHECAGELVEGRSEGSFTATRRGSFPALAPDDRREFLRLVEAALRDDDAQRRTYGTWAAIRISRALTKTETVHLAGVVAEAVANGHGDVAAELERRVRGAASLNFRTALHEQLTGLAAVTADAATHVEAVRKLVATPTYSVRRVRSAEERPR
jgi:hypothetical protein